MSILIKRATIISMDREHGSTPFQGDILIERDRIKAIGSDLEAPPTAAVINGADHLVTPGLVNAHLHSWEALFKGRYDNMPLELWMLYSYPILGCTPLEARLIYLRTMLVGMESLKNGVTCVVDDIIELPGQSMEALGAVFDAYKDLGIRANVSGHIINKPFTDTIPYAAEILPKELLRRVNAAAPPSTKDYLDFTKEALSRFQDAKGRLRYVIAPSGPQRCTDELLLGAHELATEYGTPYHIHILETKTQAVTGREFYGKTLIRHLHDVGALSERTTIAHSIWVTDEDIALMGAARCSIAHNPISNQKLGAGIAPFRKLLDAGVNVALGTDGICSNDTPRMLDVMHVAAILHKVTSPDYTKWPTADEVLRAATIGGARSAMIHDQTGSLEVGKKADLDDRFHETHPIGCHHSSLVRLACRSYILMIRSWSAYDSNHGSARLVMFNTKTVNFTPLNDLRNHVVYCENGASVATVIVNGEVVVKGGKLVRVNTATRNKLDVALSEGRHQRSRGFGRGRHRTWQRQHEADFAALADAPIDQVIVQHQGAFAGRRRALEGGPADANDRVALRECGKHIS
jgi:5-methylthioadenosine/S-adenosylhomocysteine deaminase